MRLLFSPIVKLLSGAGLFMPNGTCETSEQCDMLVLSPGEIPTTDIYFRRRMERQGKNAVRFINTLKTLPREITLGEKAKIVIVRHTPIRWLRWLKKNRSRLSGVVFFMDDDIPSILFDSELPFRYALKTAWRYARARRLLGELCTEVWVSTPELARRYAHASPKLLEPVYAAAPKESEDSRVYFYHGSWAHRREIAWLVPVVRQVQRKDPHAWFEIMGTDRVKRMFRGIPRVRVVHPMPWTDYLDYAGSVRYQVGLAPCFDTHFNQARSHSKMFDITRLGAAGIYSDCIPYAGKVVDGQTGVLCENEVEKWAAAIIRLLSQREMRESIYRCALVWCNGLEGNHRLPTERLVY